MVHAQYALLHLLQLTTSSMQCACGGQAVGYCGSALSMQKSGGHDVLGCLMNCWPVGLCIHLKAVFVACLSCKMLGR
jgi:hypothetical protein